MILLKLDFLDIVLLVFYAGLLLVTVRFIWWLAGATERLIAFLTQTGLRGMAKFTLAILIGYDEQTYHKSRFIFWNRAGVRFAILWGSFLLLACLFVLLQQLRVVGSISIAWLLAFSSYIGFRCLVYYSRPRTPLIYTQDSSLKSLIQDVNEQSPLPKRSGPPLIRRYDYLDELFAETTY